MHENVNSQTKSMDEGRVETLTAEVNKLRFREAPASTSKGNCGRCGWSNHSDKKDCPAVNAKCKECHNMGHYAR